MVFIILTKRSLKDSNVVGRHEKLLDQPTCGGVSDGKGGDYLLREPREPDAFRFPPPPGSPGGCDPGLFMPQPLTFALSGRVETSAPSTASANIGLHDSPRATAWTLPPGAPRHL